MEEGDEKGCGFRLGAWVSFITTGRMLVVRAYSAGPLLIFSIAVILPIPPLHIVVARAQDD